MKALITGGCGFIGRHFSKHLSSEGYDVTIVDDMSSNSSLYPIQWLSHLKCNVNFIEKDVVEFLKATNEKFDIVIHAAAIVGGRSVIENDPLLVSKNITFDTEMFRWIERNNPERFIYFSSSAVYPIKYQGTTNYKKLCLEDIDVVKDVIAIPDLTYGWSKLTGEFMLQILAKRTTSHISVYRPFSGFGEDQHESYPFKSILNKCMKEEVVKLWSDCFRDFVYIDDIVNYVLKTSQHDKPIEIFNIGTGIPTKMSELATIICKQINVLKSIEIEENKPKGVYYRVCQENKDYNWTSLEDAICKCLKY
jgi:nucleoside-diphosphate-sugar epimerase